MKNYDRVEADKVLLLDRHFTPGRGGAKIEFVTRHHTAMRGSLEQVRDVWKSRPASAHYGVDEHGVVAQFVWDRDTAWANADAAANARTIAIEHMNCGGPGEDWPISDVTVREGARLAASLCRFYGLGRPEFGKNVRDHREFTGTSCPYHLAFGGKYHDAWMREAQAFYDRLVSGGGVESKGDSMTDDTRRVLDVALDNQRQLRGPSLRGWPQLGKNDRGEDLTLVDAVAALRLDVAGLVRKLEDLEGSSGR